jgi:hypothetical protein
MLGTNKFTLLFGLVMFMKCVSRGLGRVGAKVDGYAELFLNLSQPLADVTQ